MWASEHPAHPLRLETHSNHLTLTGSKLFASGAGLLDRALVTVTQPSPCLIECDLRGNAAAITYDDSLWKTNAFRETHTAAATFSAVPVATENVVGEPNWYLTRPGFWHGAG